MAKTLKSLVKESLSIIEESTSKDEEIEMMIGASIQDMKRQGIEIDIDKLDELDELVKFAIVMFVKANFGMCSESEKKLAQERYILTCQNLSLSSNYKVGETND